MTTDQSKTRIRKSNSLTYSPYSRSWPLMDIHFFFASLVYLCIPALIFLATWLKGGLALPCGLLFFAGLIWESRAIFRQRSTSWRPSPSTCRYLAISLSVLTVWLLVSGIGGAGYQNSDHAFSNAMFLDLINQSWPLRYSTAGDGGTGETFNLVYYVGFYLPAALIGKLLGWQAANVFLFVWAWLGVVLAFYWFVRFLPVRNRTRAAPIAAIVFSLASGLDIVGTLLLQKELPAMGTHLEWWAILFQYSGQSTLLLWVPQHVIPGWILAGMVWQQATEEPSPTRANALGLAWIAAAISTPFVVLGTAPFMLFILVRMLSHDALRTFRSFFSISALAAAPAAAIPIFLFLKSNRFEFPIQPSWEYAQFATNYPLFLILEVGVFAALIAVMGFRSPVQRRLFWLSIAILGILPLVRFGHFNDLVMRVSIPALLYLHRDQVGVICQLSLRFRSVRSTPVALGLAISAIVLTIVGSVTSLSEIWRGVKTSQWGPPAAAGITRFIDTGHQNTIDQRQGANDSVFFQYLARPAASSSVNDTP